jgi:hypothetical protein
MFEAFRQRGLAMHGDGVTRTWLVLRANGRGEGRKRDSNDDGLQPAQAEYRHGHTPFDSLETAYFYHSAGFTFLPKIARCAPAQRSHEVPFRALLTRRFQLSERQKSR